MTRQYLTRTSHLTNDPSYHPHTLITRRLQNANKLHSSLLSERCTLQTSSQPLHPIIPPSVHPLAAISVNRPTCPPLDDGLGGGSSTSPNVRIVQDVKLTPLERAAPHRIVVPTEFEGVRGELDGASSHIKSSVWNGITALSSLCDEVYELETTFTTLYPSIILFSARQVTKLDEEGERARHSELLKSMGALIPTLQVVENGCVRLKRLVRNMVVQLGGCGTPSFSGEGSPTAASVSDANAATDGGTEGEEKQEEQPPVFGSEVSLVLLGKAIGTALRILITVDSAVASNEDLAEAWGMFKDVVMDYSEEKRAANKLDPEFESFERMLIRLDYSLMSSRSFLSTIQQNFDPNARFARANYNLHDEIHSIINTLYGTYCERINTEHEATERLDCVGVYALYVLYRHLLPTKRVPDAKLHKQLWSVFPAMCPVLELYGPLHFIPREFIMVHAPYEAVKGCSADVNEIRQTSASLVLKWDGSFKARVTKIRLDALAWLAVADAELSPTPEDYDTEEEFNPVSSVENIERATSCILRGMKIAYSASITLRSQLATHKALGLDHNPEDISSCLLLVVVLKSVEKMLRVRRRTAVFAFQRGTLKMIASNILKRFGNIRSFVDQYSTSESSRSPESARSFARVSACLSALEGILKGSSSFSPIRRYSICLAVAACMDSLVMGRFAADDARAVEGHLKDLNEISSIEEILSKVCDCSFIYFYRDLYPAFFDYLYETSLNSSVGNTHLVLSALSDPARMLMHVKHTDCDAFMADYQSSLLQFIRENFVVPTCEVIEFNLRLSQHSKSERQQGSKRNEEYDDRRVRALLLGPPLYVCQKKLNLKVEVEEEMGRNFYNLCALSLSDCNTYAEIRSLASERYGLNIADPYLPDGSMDQKFNLFDVLRDFESFISRFNYNMVEQVFVERKPERGAKFLSTFGVKCISASIAQHGSGIVKLAIDISYKVLSQKFQLFIQFLTNDYIKSLLAKELRWFTNHRSEGNSFYPFERASTFAKEVNKSEGSADDSNPGLEECRTLLVSIGNIIAFVRMARTASKKLSSDEMSYLPPPIRLSKHSVQNTPQPGANSQNELGKLLVDQYHQQDSDYVRAFVDVFKGVFLESNAPPTNGFFCLVPSLCLNWMDASVQGKEMMHKKNITRDGYYTDDGFAVGLTFSLLVLDQIKQYESLHWFKSVQNKYSMDEEDLIEKESAAEVKTNAKRAANKQGSWFSAGAEATPDEEEMTILKMMRKRLDGNKREMAMLFFTMHGAERFFKDIQSPMD